MNPEPMIHQIVIHQFIELEMFLALVDRVGASVQRQLTLDHLGGHIRVEIWGDFRYGF